MSKKKRVKAKPLPADKTHQRLAADDYVDPDRGEAFSDSDILSPQGVTVKDSNQESREERAQKTWAQREEEERREADESSRFAGR